MTKHTFCKSCGASVELRDQYHTMDELYYYRMLYNAAFANATMWPAVKSKRHHDGELCFGGGWFIVVIMLPNGQISNHYKEEFWDLFQIPEVEIPPTYDGHTPAEAASRLLLYVADLWHAGIPKYMAKNISKAKD